MITLKARYILYRCGIHRRDWGVDCVQVKDFMVKIPNIRLVG